MALLEQFCQSSCGYGMYYSCKFHSLNCLNYVSKYWDVKLVGFLLSSLELQGVIYSIMMSCLRAAAFFKEQVMCVLYREFIKILCA